MVLISFAAALTVYFILLAGVACYRSVTAVKSEQGDASEEIGMASIVNNLVRHWNARISRI